MVPAYGMLFYPRILVLSMDGVHGTVGLSRRSYAMVCRAAIRGSAAGVTAASAFN